MTYLWRYRITRMQLIRVAGHLGVRLPATPPPPSPQQLTAGDVSQKSAIMCPRPWACRQSKGNSTNCIVTRCWWWGWLCVCCGVVGWNRRAVARRAVLSAQGVRSVQSTVLCQSVLCVSVRGALRYVPVRQKAHELPATSFSTGATVGAQLSPPPRHQWNSLDQRNRDIDHHVHGGGESPWSAKPWGSNSAPRQVKTLLMSSNCGT